MRSKRFSVSLAVVVAGLMALNGMAQNQIPHRGMGHLAIPSQAHANPVILTGTVTATNLAPGQGMPTITFQDNVLGSITVMVGPYRVLADSKFEIKTGQALEITAFPDPRLAQAYVAIEIKDSKGASVVLRGTSGVAHSSSAAMGMGRGGAMGWGVMHGAGAMQGMQAAGACDMCGTLDLQAKKTFVGTVQTVEMGAGQGFPRFTLLSGNELVSIVASPYWILKQAGFQISQGDNLSVVAYPSLRHDGTYVAAEILNGKTNRSIKLRDEKGMPVGIRGRGPMRGGWR